MPTTRLTTKRLVKKIAFGKQPYVASAVFMTVGTDIDRATTYVQQWRADKTVQVRVFRRTVRASDIGHLVLLIVVRRKVVA